MKLSDVFMLFGGLALFLYGMKMMSEGLEMAAGNKMKQILEKLTTNRILGVLVGAVITAIIQSSSATTVMVVGFVNSNLMKLSQAVWVIMGANIGTTITGQLIALDVGLIAPVIAFIGVVMVSFFKKRSIKCAGEIVAGLGILFVGMNLMSDSMAPLSQSEAFVSLMTTFKNPLLGILAGMLFTAVIQSSSASIGILQALAMSGVIGIDSAVFVLFGQNIGTCITAVLASLNANRNAKRTTIIHLMFNVIGTAIFVTICLLSPFTSWVASFTPDAVAAQIANVHTIFNITTTLLLLPFGNYLAKLSTMILPVKADENTQMKMMFVEEHNIGASAIAIGGLKQEVQRMFTIAQDNLALCMESVINKNTSKWDTIEKNEEYIDFLNTELARYTARASVDMNEQDSRITTSLFNITGNIERIGDHAMNLAEHASAMLERKTEFTKASVKELVTLQSVIMQSVDILNHSQISADRLALEAIAEQEQQVDDLIAEYRDNQISRLKKQKCSAEACVMYSEILTDIERISDHLLNIAQICNQTEIELQEVFA